MSGEQAAVGQSGEIDASQVVVEEEWGVVYGDPPVLTSIRPTGTGFWGQRHAEQEVERTLHNAKLSFVGQPQTASVVHRTVTRYYDATAWERVTSPAPTHEFTEDVNDGSMCVCGIPALTHEQVYPPESSGGEDRG